ncbi:MAG: hypothetical protein AMJ75_05710 [Phycisphaerae bacterium SM1_79]|nr:MAG: hypothetical protein AMJ75_05710 [Phycisphaerae bacterium SM1_79]
MICHTYISGRHRSSQPTSGRTKAICGKTGNGGFTCVFTSAIIITAVIGWPGLVKGDTNYPLDAIDIRHIKVGGMIGRKIDMTIKNNLLVLDYEKDFLGPFKSKSSDYGFIGLGNVIDAIARLAAYSGEPKLLELKKKLVTELIGLQEDSGYIGIMKPESRVWGLWEISEMAYIVNGLITDYELFGEKKSLDAAVKLADYYTNRWMAEPNAVPGGGHLQSYMTVVGSEAVMMRLYGLTRGPRHLGYVTELRKVQQWEGPLVLGRHGKIFGHAYTYLGVCLAQLRLYRITHDAKLLKAARTAFDFMLNGDGMVVTGQVGDHECWHNTQSGTANLGETCATAYLLHLLDEWLRLRADSLAGDIMERIIYNGLFAAQSPDGRRIRYYTPFECPRGGYFRDTYCCPSNYRRVISRLPEFVYYRTRKGIVVNLYTPSETRIALADGTIINLCQETSYPYKGKVILHVNPDKTADFQLKLRIPRWSDSANVTVNGQGQTVACKGSWHVIERKWQKGDKVELNMPMKWRFIKGRKSQVGRVAIMRGPLVFGINRANIVSNTNKQPQIQNRRTFSSGEVAIENFTTGKVRVLNAALNINLYARPEEKIELSDDTELHIRQETDSPCDGDVAIHIDPEKPIKFPLRFRIPNWCLNKCDIYVNNKKEHTALADESVVIDRVWNQGDRVDLKVQSMDLRMITIDPQSIKGPFQEERFPGGRITARLNAWPPRAWYPSDRDRDLTLTLTEFRDPASEFIYFHVPDPEDKFFVEDELSQVQIAD